MTPPFSDELISAYLDGELTPDQQALVEQQLNQRADLRRMCDDLRLLRRTLQAMPVAEPPDNLVERVLRQAERRMLAGESLDASPVQALHEPAAPRSPQIARRPMHPWGLIATAVAAVAAAGLVIIIWPRDVARHVAQAPTARRESMAAAKVAEYAPDAEVRNVPALSEERDFAYAARELETAGGGTDPAAMTGPAASEGGIAPPAPAPAGGPAVMGGAGALRSSIGGSPGTGAAAGGLGDPRSSVAQPARGENESLEFGHDVAPAMPGMMMGRMSADAPAPVPPAAAMVGPVPPAAPARPGPGTGAADSRGAEAGQATSELETDLAAHPYHQAQQEIVEQIVSQLNHDQLLLVRVQLPERELSPTLVELSNSNRTNVLTAAGSIVPVEQATVADGTAETPLADRVSALQVPARDETQVRQLQRDLMTPNTVIVDGSSEQIRQSLHELSTRRGVEIQPVTLDPLADRTRAMQQLGDAAAPGADVVAGQRLQAGLGKAKDDAKTEATRERETRETLAERTDSAEDNLTIFYLLLRLWNEPAAGPASEPAGPTDTPP